MAINNTKRNKGFTILETLIAVMLLSLVLNSVFTLISGTLFSAQYAKNEMIATYLLQESVDYIRNDRDSLVKDTANGWNNFLALYSLNGSSRSYCRVDVSPENRTVLPNCSNQSVSENIYYNPDMYKGSFYTSQKAPAGSLDTSFTRTISMRKKPSNSDEVDFSITVSWKNGQNTKTKSYNGSLLKW